MRPRIGGGGCAGGRREHRHGAVEAIAPGSRGELPAARLAGGRLRHAAQLIARGGSLVEGGKHHLRRGHLVEADPGGDAELGQVKRGVEGRHDGLHDGIADIAGVAARHRCVGREKSRDRRAAGRVEGRRLRPEGRRGGGCKRGPERALGDGTAVGVNWSVSVRLGNGDTDGRRILR